jgi:hypothetical protein
VTGVADWIVAKTADLARPFVLYSLGGSTAYAIVHIAQGGVHLVDSVGFLGAALAGVSAIYVGKAVEETRKAGHDADVAKAQAQNQPAVVVAPPPDPDPAEWGGPRP